MTATLLPPARPAPAPPPEPPPSSLAERPVVAHETHSRPAVLTRLASLRGPVGSQVGKAVGPIRRTVTPLGALVVIVAVAAFVASRYTGWQELTVLAAALAGAFVVAAAFVVGRAQYRVVLDLRSRRVTVGERATGRLTVTNASRHRLLPARLELPVGVAIASLAVPSLAGGEMHEELFVVPTQRRAVIPVGPARSVRGDAFGLLRRENRWTEQENLYVHPRTLALQGATPGFLKDLEGQATRDLSNDDVSFHALRQYVPGDDRRYIHWKTSARTGQLMVRQFEETRRSHLAVTLSTRTEDYAEPDEFEIAVEAAASIGVQAFRDERQLSVVTSRAALPSPTQQRMLDGFSGLELSDNADGIVALAHSAAGYASGVSVAFLVCGATPTPGQIRSAAAAFPVGVRVIAVRAVLGAATGIARIGAVSVLTIGALDDLARGLRQAARSV